MHRDGRDLEIEEVPVHEERCVPVLLVGEPGDAASVRGRMGAHQTLSADDGDELLGIDADRGAGGARPHAGRAALDALAHVALDRVLAAGALGEPLGRLVLARAVAAAEEQPAQEARLLRRHRRHLDDAIGAVALAIAAADALVVDEHLAVGRAVDRVGRAVLHAVRILAVPARGRDVDGGEGRAGLAVETADAVMGLGARLLAIVAAHAQRFVDQQDVGRLAEPVADQELDEAAMLAAGFHPLLLASGGPRAASRPRGANAARARASERKAALSISIASVSDRGLDGGVALGVGQHRHLADVIAGGEIARARCPCRRYCARPSPTPCGSDRQARHPRLP